MLPIIHNTLKYFMHLNFALHNSKTTFLVLANTLRYILRLHDLSLHNIKLKIQYKNFNICLFFS